MDKIKYIKIENGYCEFKLGNVLDSDKVSINKLMRDSNTDFKTIKRLINGKSVKIDIYVLARICDALKCNSSDIFEYISNCEINENNI